uniref:Uncharacterized protein n=1 Tax=Arundo donax TaxID=35708 RepID=A0A0A9DGQ2_ARUDO
MIERVESTHFLTVHIIRYQLTIPSEENQIAVRMNGDYIEVNSSFATLFSKQVQKAQSVLQDQFLHIIILKNPDGQFIASSFCIINILCTNISIQSRGDIIIIIIIILFLMIDVMQAPLGLTNKIRVCNCVRYFPSHI